MANTKRIDDIRRKHQDRVGKMTEEERNKMKAEYRKINGNLDMVVPALKDIQPTYSFIKRIKILFTGKA